MENTTEIIGLPELMKAIMKISEDAIPVISQVSIEGAQIVKEKAKMNLLSHNKTGALSENLMINKPKRSHRYKYNIFSTVYFDIDGRHGVPLELGHSIVRNGKKVGTVKEKPFLRPAADTSAAEIEKKIIQAMNDVLDKMGGIK